MEPWPETLNDEFLALYNQSWCDAVNGLGQRVGHGKISAEKFDDFLFLESVVFESEGTVELWFYDNDEMFYGHMIRVALDPSMKITSTGLAG